MSLVEKPKPPFSKRFISGSLPNQPLASTNVSNFIPLLILITLTNMLPFTLNNLNYYINVTIIILPPTRKGSNYSVQAVNILCKEPGLLPTSYTNPKFRKDLNRRINYLNK